MLEDNQDTVPVFGQRSAEREQIVARFEDAWQRDEHPTIEDYVVAEGDERQAILVELVHAELECRLKAGDSARVEEYLERYPELAGDGNTVIELVDTEYSTRCSHDRSTTVAEYLERFPQFQEELAERLASQSPLGGHTGRPIRLTCPHCQNPVAIADDAPGDDVVCPSCGSSFRFVLDQTLSWRPEELPGRSDGLPRQPDKLRVLGKFELLESVGQGAFGTVYKARDTELDRIVAVKVPRSGTFATADDEDRDLALAIQSRRKTPGLHIVGSHHQDLGHGQRPVACQLRHTAVGNVGILLQRRRNHAVDHRQGGGHRSPRGHGRIGRHPITPFPVEDFLLATDGRARLGS